MSESTITPVSSSVDWAAHQKRALLIRDPAVRDAMLDAIDRDRVHYETCHGDLTTGQDAHSAELISIRHALDVLGRRLAVDRAAPPVVPDAMSATGRHVAVNLAGAEHALADLSLWKARPTLVTGAVAAVLAMAVGFGLPITAAQQGLVTAAAIAVLAVIGSMRGRQTATAAIAAASLAVASVPPLPPVPGTPKPKEP